MSINKNSPKVLGIKRKHCFDPGTRFGKLIILEAPIINGYVKVKCECGTICFKYKAQLINGMNCCAKGECKKSRVIDLTGQTFAFLKVDEIVVDKTLIKKRGRVSWHCTCICGNKTVVSADKLRRRHTKSCGCQQFKGKIRTVSDFDCAFNTLLATYKRRAIKLDRTFELDRDLLIQFCTSTCHYCGSPPKNTMVVSRKVSKETIFYNGIDRKNNCIGYTLENCVTCCGTCNYAKGDLNYEEFLNLVRKIASRFPL